METDKRTIEDAIKAVDSLIIKATFHKNMAYYDKLNKLKHWFTDMQKHRTQELKAYQAARERSAERTNTQTERPRKEISFDAKPWMWLVIDQWKTIIG